MGRLAQVHLRSQWCVLPLSAHFAGRRSRDAYSRSAAHRRWHYTLGAPPVRHVKWFVRSVGAPPSETAANLLRSFAAWVTGGVPPWVVEAREAAAEANADEDQDTKGEGVDDAQAGGSHKSHSTTSSVRSAKALASYKRHVMVVGVIATAICWAVFTWFIFTCACVCRAFAAGAVLTRRCADGMLIYRLLGDEAEQSFARSWGISYGVGAAQEARAFAWPGRTKFARC